MRTDVAATLTMTSPEPATALLQIAVAEPAGEQLSVLSAGRVLETGPPASILRADLLDCLFRARFEIVRGGERPVTVLHLGPPPSGPPPLP